MIQHGDGEGVAVDEGRLCGCASEPLLLEDVHTWALSEGALLEAVRVHCPQRVDAVLDGRSFSVRVRHGYAELTSPAGDRVLMVWHDGQYQRSLAVLFDLVAQVVRDAVRRDSCTHDAAGRFCSDCGQRLSR